MTPETRIRKEDISSIQSLDLLRHFSNRESCGGSLSHDHEANTLAASSLKLDECNWSSQFIGRDFYNAIFPKAWDIDALELFLYAEIESKGSFVLSVIQETVTGSRRIVGTQDYAGNDSAKEIQHIVKIKEADEDACCFYAMLSHQDQDIKIRRLEWMTRKGSLCTHAMLAVVVTHYQREQALSHFVKKISNSQAWKYVKDNRIKIILIDNSNSLDATTFPSEIIVIPNKNYGGAGGFSRGLQEASRIQCSHCLFMDDDISITAGCIERTFNFIRLRQNARIALGGIMLQDEAPFLTLEKGANFGPSCKPLFANIPINNFSQVKLLMSDQSKVDYVSWCFFCFPLSQVKNYPFPFFVRGDDILFSIQNHFNTRFLNGVTARVMRYERKEGPLQAILDWRRNIMICNYLGGLKFALTIDYLLNYLNYLITYRYGHCMAMSTAVSFCFHCEHSFSDDIKGLKVMNKSRVYLERYWKNIAISDPSSIGKIIKYSSGRDQHKSLASKLLSILTLGFHLLPFGNVLKFQESKVAYFQRRINFADYLYAKEILYFDHLDDSANCRTISCTFDQAAGFKCILHLHYDMARILWLSFINSKKISKTIASLATESYWRSVFSLDLQSINET